MRASILRRCRTRLNDGLAVPWHPAAVQVERSRLGVPSALPSSAELALPAEDGRGSVDARGPIRCAHCGRCRPDGAAVGAGECCDAAARLPWHPAAVQVERSRLDVPSARPSSAGLALPAEDGRLWSGGKRAGWNRGHDLATGAALNQAARDGEIRRRLAAGESVRAFARALRCGPATVQRARLAG